LRPAWERADDRLKAILKELWDNIIPIAGFAVAIGGITLAAPPLGEMLIALLALLDLAGTLAAGYSGVTSFGNFLTLLNHAKDENDLSQAADELLTTVENLTLFTAGVVGFAKMLPNLKALFSTVLREGKSLLQDPAKLAEFVPFIKRLLEGLGDTFKSILEGSKAGAQRAGKLIAQLFKNLDVAMVLFSVSPKGALKAIFTMDKGAEVVTALSSLIGPLKGTKGLEGLKEFLAGASEIQLKRLIPISKQLLAPENAKVVEFLKLNSRAIKAILETQPKMSIAELRKLLNIKDMSPERLLHLLFDIPGMSIAELKSLLKINGMSPDLLSKLLDAPGMSIAQLKSLLKINGMTAERLSHLLFDVPGMSIAKLKQLLERTGMTPSILVDLFFNKPGMTIQILEELLSVKNMTPSLLQYILIKKDMKIAALEELLIRADMPVSQLKEYIAKLGVTQTEVLLQKYGGDAMKYYGASWFKAFKGIDTNVRFHLVDEVKTGGGQVKGCHDTATFESLYVTASPPKIIVHSKRQVGTYTEYEYNLVTSTGGQPKFKTTRNNLARDWSQVLDNLNDELDRLIRTNEFPKVDGGPFTVQYEGVIWIFYFRANSITTIYPVL
jgi:hypothetical protein